MELFRSDRFTRNMTSIDLLNRRLGDALGRLPNGCSRFQWVRASEAKYYVVRGGAVFEIAWSSRIGDVWILARWSEPTVFDPKLQITKVMTEESWRETLGNIPYPRNGTWRGYPETALPPGEYPTESRTANHIREADKQMSQDYADHLDAVNVEMKLDKEQQDSDWDRYVLGQVPASNNWASGQRGGSVSYGGI